MSARLSVLTGVDVVGLSVKVSVIGITFTRLVAFSVSYDYGTPFSHLFAWFSLWTTVKDFLVIYVLLHCVLFQRLYSGALVVRWFCFIFIGYFTSCPTAFVVCTSWYIVSSSTTFYSLKNSYGVSNITFCSIPFDCCTFAGIESFLVAVVLVIDFIYQVINASW